MANENGKTTRTRDWVTLHEDTSLALDGVEFRIDRMSRELKRLLGNHQNAAPIMQLLTRPNDGYAAMIAKRTVLAVKVTQYAAKVAEMSEQTVSEIPLNPDDESTTVANGVVAGVA